jgi:hypothetical protein
VAVRESIGSRVNSYRTAAASLQWVKNCPLANGRFWRKAALHRHVRTLGWKGSGISGSSGPLMAPLRHADRLRKCPLVGEDQKRTEHAQSDAGPADYSGNLIRLTNCVNRGSERSPFQRGSRRNQTSQFDLSSKALLSDAKAASF